MRTNSSSAATKYQHSQVTHADPVQLIVMLYDGALARIAQGRQRLQEKDLLQAGLAISKAQAIVGELRQSLNMEAGGDVAGNLSRLYAYIHDLLVKAQRGNLAEPLEEATNLLNELRGAWSEVAKQVKAVLETNQTAMRSQGAAGGNQDTTRVQVKA
jgi:flagellar secretion chaperone FliS